MNATTPGTKEFYEMMDCFERHVSRSGMVSNCRLDRDASRANGNFYEDGHANQLFHMYMAGYQHARVTNL